MTARQDFKKAFRAVRVFARGATTVDVNRAIVGVGFDGQLAISAGYAYDASVSAQIAISAADFHGAGQVACAAASAFAWRLWAQEHPVLPLAERASAARRAWDDADAYEYC